VELNSGISEAAARYFSRTSSYDWVVPLLDAARPVKCSAEVKIKSISRPPVLEQGAPLDVTINFEALTAMREIVFGIGLCDAHGQRILSCDTDYNETMPSINVSAGHHTLKLSIPNLPLLPAEYGLDVGCKVSGGNMLDNVPGACFIRVTPSRLGIGSGKADYHSATATAHWEILDAEQ
jgi:hypothetical protein